MNDGCSGNDLEVTRLQVTRHLEIFLETLSRTMKEKNVIIRKLLIIILEEYLTFRDRRILATRVYL